MPSANPNYVEINPTVHSALPNNLVVDTGDNTQPPPSTPGQIPWVWIGVGAAVIAVWYFFLRK